MQRHIAVIGLALFCGSLVLGGCGGPQYVYVVKEGDSNLGTVSKAVYGDAGYCDVIAKANPGVDAAALEPGQELTIPKIEGVVEPKGCTRKGVY